MATWSDVGCHLTILTSLLLLVTIAASPLPETGDNISQTIKAQLPQTKQSGNTENLPSQKTAIPVLAEPHHDEDKNTVPSQSSATGDAITNTNVASDSEANPSGPDVPHGQKPTYQSFQSAGASGPPMATIEESFRPDEITTNLARRVLNAFFEGLKRRPDLVEEILERETYRLLINSGLGYNLFGLASPQDLQSQNGIQGAVPIRNENNVGRSEPRENSAALNTNSMVSVAGEKSNNGDGSKRFLGVTRRDASPGGTGSAIPLASDGSLEGGKPEARQAIGNADHVDVNTDTVPNEGNLMVPYYYYVFYDTEDGNTAQDTKPVDGKISATATSDNGNPGMIESAAAPSQNSAGGDSAHATNENPAQSVVVLPGSAVDLGTKADTRSQAKFPVLRDIDMMGHGPWKNAGGALEKARHEARMSNEEAELTQLSQVQKQKAVKS